MILSVPDSCKNFAIRAGGQTLLGTVPMGGFCHCRAPYWGVDCAMGGSDAPRCSARPCVYVYELPARMNVLSFRSNGARWHTHESDEHMPQTLHLALLASPHRTSDANEADFFFVPVWDFVGFGWGSPAVYWRAHRYVTTAWPYFNRSGGRDHLWPVARDAGSCATPWGSLLDELRNGIVLSKPAFRQLPGIRAS